MIFMKIMNMGRLYCSVGEQLTETRDDGFNNDDDGNDFDADDDDDEKVVIVLVLRLGWQRPRVGTTMTMSARAESKLLGKTLIARFMTMNMRIIIIMEIHILDGHNHTDDSDGNNGGLEKGMLPWNWLPRQYCV